jgi:hypothetical protein
MNIANFAHQSAEQSNAATSLWIIAITLIAAGMLAVTIKALSNRAPEVIRKENQDERN